MFPFVNFHCFPTMKSGSSGGTPPFRRLSALTHPGGGGVGYPNRRPTQCTQAQWGEVGRESTEQRTWSRPAHAYRMEAPCPSPWWGGRGYTTRRRRRNRNGGVKTTAWRTFRRRSALHRAVKNKWVTVQGPVKIPQMDCMSHRGGLRGGGGGGGGGGPATQPLLAARLAPRETRQC